MTSTEIAVPQNLLDPRSGELVEATPEKAVELLAVIRDIRGRLMGPVKDCEAVLLEESRRQGTKTLSYGKASAVITGGSEILWDVPVLAELLPLGLSMERFGELVTETVSYKVNNSVAKQLEAANPAYAEVISRARGRTDKPWRVNIR